MATNFTVYTGELPDRDNGSNVTSLPVDGKGRLIVSGAAGGGGGASAEYNATLPTYTDGADATLQTNQKGVLLVGVTDLTGAQGDLTDLGQQAANQSISTTPPTEMATLHGAAAGTLPILTGGEARNAFGTAVDNGDAARVLLDLLGRTVIKAFAPSELDWSYAAAASGIVNTTTAVTFKAAAGSGLRNYITSLQISSEALTNATEVAIRDGAAGTVLWRMKIPTTGLPGVFGATFSSPLKGTANTLLEVVTLTASGAGAVYFSAQGYAGP